MKRFNHILLTAFVLMIVLSVWSFNIHAQTPDTVKRSDKVLKDTLIRSVNYKLYVGLRGGKYVLRTSKTGKVYKQYIKK